MALKRGFWSPKRFTLHKKTEKLRRNELRSLKAHSLRIQKLELLEHLTKSISLSRALQAVTSSTSQNGQDLFALCANNFVTGGFFVEVGAANGKDLSNTWLLETKFNWNGVLVEPNSTFLKELYKNRSRQVIVEKAAWSRSGESLEFLEANELSTLSGFEKQDSLDRTILRTYPVTTITLTAVLDKYESPKIVNFLSVDTEGTEVEVLKGIDWFRYRFNAIVVEHNFTAAREEINQFLEARGYLQVHSNLSGQDSWFVPIETESRSA